MGLFDIFKKENKENKKAIFISNAGGMIITKSLLEGKSKLKWIFRENSTNAADNGWRAIGDTDTQTSVYKGYKQDKIEMRGDRAEMSDFPLYLNTVAGGLDRRDQTIGGFSFVVKIYTVPVVEIIG